MQLVVQNKNQLPRRLRKLSAWDKGIIQRFGAYEENRNFPVELESQKEYRQKKAQVKKKKGHEKRIQAKWTKFSMLSWRSWCMLWRQEVKKK